ncbi:chorismate binding enzyme [Anaerobacterium chartisolvens]|uniref:Anthranilate synthase component 1 n=1 Tax=Anaerobacterium chartisolvens TaxID=1297424 RepID=A0A369AUF1_9FIRM|nr:chorismate-binding protein [Anaerobacterium chartisolvens]RCX12959.1 chorismate binding enzyme [Anaerobacterium chartisolvens]
MFYPDLENVKILAEKYNVIPVAMEVYADMETPISLFKRFEDSSFCFLLESVEGGEKWARYSFIGRTPFLIVKGSQGATVIEDGQGNITPKSANAMKIIKELMSCYKGADIPGLPRFNGGAVGFLGNDPEFAETHFMFTDEVLVFDHLKQKIHIIVNLHVNGNVERGYNSSIDRIKAIYKEILTTRWKVTDSFTPGSVPAPFEYSSNITRESFCQNVMRARQNIINGAASSAVISQRLCAETGREPLEVYRALRSISPSPYMYYLKFKDYSLAGSSHKMLVRVENGDVEPCSAAGAGKKENLMEIIDELEEGVKTGEYRGAIGYLGFNGSLDSCADISTIVFKDKKAYVQVGAEISFDSDPAGKYEETLNSAEAMLKAL